MVIIFLSLTVASASAQPTTTQEPSPMIKCRNNSHVWNPEQCDRPAPFTIGGGGSGQGRGGLLGTIGGIIDRVTGGIL
ncbi:hypothetical protein HWB51_gp028 [Mycobacterium phage Cuke]|uniref:Uncharacterized protein n=1 Tax=Mycobacterium phage Cuke TaxID=2079417 RepID=A0A2L1IWV0_9CAUD|nr:hypothetical protein HWB51_gp028 [Mycobacterium phage Cuke]AVD99646.1 hypothetical protein SEA_CUKE_28 [Mycobacterium phage Cuke]